LRRASIAGLGKPSLKARLDELIPTGVVPPEAHQPDRPGSAFVPARPLRPSSQLLSKGAVGGPVPSPVAVAPLGASREKREGVDMLGAHDAEVSSVDRRDVGDAEALRGGDHRGVDRSERKVAVRRDELGDSQPVSGWYGVDCEHARCQVADESNLRLDAESCREQVRHLGDDEHWDDQWARVTLEQLER
jgi:hypothetical protein